MNPPSNFSIPELPSHGAIQALLKDTLPSSRERQSTTFSREARLHSPWKRSACDRCRSLKLKCERDTKSTAQPCIRCIRAKATCFTSSAKPSTRLTRARTSGRAVSPAPSPAPTNADIADTRRCGESQGPMSVTQVNLSSATNQEAPFLMHWPFTYQDDDASKLNINIDFDVDMPSSMNEGGRVNYLHSSADGNKPPIHLDHRLSPANTSTAPTTPTLALDSPSQVFSGARV
ncbi:hypothetical protein F5Y12DRAFT_555235 [Xylaria sp. FL1777]|nr:hypothetical protein F5Y12DRAFT_555235 [Xylaria sp. FL1777]